MSLFSFVFSVSLLSLLIHPSFSQPSCKSIKFSSKKTFENCNELPTLNAVLHWSYTPANSSLSMAFTASPSKPEGWVAWGLNPTGTGMAGTQALLAHKPKASGPITVDTYDIQSYHDINKGPISYNVSSISGEESSGMITIFATWALPKGESKFNQVWQEGPMNNGKLGKHEFEPANLGAKMELSLFASAPNGAPAGSPAATPSGSSMDSSAPTPASGNNTGGGERLVSGVLAFGAIVASLMV